MKWQASAAMTLAFWLLEALVVFLASGDVTTPALVAVLLLPIACGFLSGLIRPRLPGFSLLLCATVAAAAAAIASLAQTSPDDGEYAEAGKAILTTYMIGVALLTCVAAVLGALVAARFRQLLSEDG
jgi:hypothetical protein